MDPIRFTPIGIIHSPYTTKAGTPIQPGRLARAAGQVEVFPEYQAGLKDLDGFSMIYLLFHLHAMRDVRLEVTPYLDDVTRGVFATRAPSRPNPIGLSLVKLISVKNGTLEVAGLDILDGTPLLDIKPFIPNVDHFEDIRVGWLEGKTERFQTHRADGRF